MTVDLLFYSVSAIFVLMLAFMLFMKGYRSWIFGVFGSFFSLGLILLLLFSMYTAYSSPADLKVTNYSSKAGNLFFFTETGCEAPVRYDFPINANEESGFEVENPDGGFQQIILAGANDQLFYVPVPEAGSEELDIWEKELTLADSCFREQIETYQRGQVKFSVVIGLSLMALLLLFWYRWKKKMNSVVV